VIYKFNNIELDTEQYRLLVDNKETSVEPQVFNLIIFLIENKETIVSRDCILNHVWKGRVVSDTSINNHIKSARKVLGDDGTKQQVIKTIHSRGYQFVAQLNEANKLDNEKPLPLLNKEQSEGSLIAVLPLQNNSSDREQDYFAEGISEDLTTELFKFNHIQVIARHTAFQYDSKSFDVSQLRDELGIDYFIEGSVRKNGPNIRINIQLIDTLKNNQVWAEKYDDAYEKIHTIIDDIIEQVVSTVSTEILRVETHKSLARNSSNLRAYDHFLRGLHYHKICDNGNPNNIKAVTEFKKAVELDPYFTRAHAWLVCAQFSTWDRITDQKLIKELGYVKSALQFNQNDPDIHRILGAIYFHLSEFKLAAHHFDEATRLSPNDTNIIIKAATFFAYYDKSDKATALLQRVFRLNPRHPNWYWQEFGIINYCLENHAQAIENFQKNMKSEEFNFAMIAACYSAIEDKKNARKYALMTLKINPRASVALLTQYCTFRSADKHQLLIKRMIAAGINP
jgi:TolB-like protein/Tfp pilus assembly protein PilF